MVRTKQTLRRCGGGEARARVVDARAFLDAAVSTDNADVKATNSIHAGIAAADAICCSALNQRSAGPRHAAAVDLLRTVDAKLANDLARLLDLKTQAAYEEREVPMTKAAAAVKLARQLLKAAEDRLLST